ncbi:MULTISPECIES: hypothetical protein [unclassified Microbacterium]|uniref:hypothetical protein n=1 Tax=unclassified Microbacterium TaxID=2609290 RepID=UPI00386BB041
MTEQAPTQSKLSSDWGRVVRSPVPKRGEVVVMSGVQFKDGKDRVIVGYDITPEQVVELDAALTQRDEAEERLQRMISAINALMAKGAQR